jgi:hypothetical protein
VNDAAVQHRLAGVQPELYQRLRADPCDAFGWFIVAAHDICLFSDEEK